jgi:hypothetical protein
MMNCELSIILASGVNVRIAPVAGH